MANKARGEVDLPIGQKNYTLCMTLGALAAIEDKFQITDLSQLGTVFAQPNAKTIVSLLAILLRGGAEAEGAQPDQAQIDEERVRAMPINLKNAMSAMMETFKLTNMADEPPAGEDAPVGDAPTAG